jgi:hypothetical protein
MTRTDLDRRRFLTLAGAGAAGLAGCTQFSGGGGGGDGAATPAAQSDPGSGSGGGRTVTMLVQPDPTALREAQLAVSDALDSGEINQTEARRRLATREQELVREAVTAVRERVADGSPTVRDVVESEAALLVEGDPGALIDLLETPLVSAMLAERRFSEARARAQQDDGASESVTTDETE